MLCFNVVRVVFRVRFASIGAVFKVAPGRRIDDNSAFGL